MEKYKVNIDRPSVSTEEIMARDSFDSLLKDYNIVSKSKKMDWEIRGGKVVGKGFDFSGKWIVSSVAVIAISAFLLINYQKDKAIKEIFNRDLLSRASKKSLGKPDKKNSSVTQEPHKVELKNNDPIIYSKDKNIDEIEIEEDQTDGNEQSLEEEGPLVVNSKTEIIVPKLPPDPLRNIIEKPSDKHFNNNVAEETTGNTSIKSEQKSTVENRESNANIVDSKPLKQKDSREKKKLKIEGFNFGKGIKNKETTEKESEKIAVETKSNLKENKIAEIQKKKTNQQIDQLTEEIAELKKEIEEKEKNNLLRPQRANPSKHQFNLGILSKEFPELAKLKGVLFEISDENPTFLPEHKEIEWENGEIKEGTKRGNYELTLTKGKTATTYIVYPVYIGKDFDNALKEFNKYENSIVEMKQQLREKNMELRVLQKQK